MKGYEGKVKNTGTQIVKAPYPQSGGGKKSTVKTGDDLRAGKSGKGK